jgi:type I restriction enzyme S subunit
VKSASKLLLRIQAEKARLIADKKLRPEKSLPKITPAEIPFEIPKGWEWCRFGQITRAYEAGSSFKCEDREVVDEEWGVIKTSAVTSGDFAERENKFLRTDAPADTTAQVAVGDLIFCRASGSKGLAGKCAIVRECSRNLLLSDKTIRVPLMEGISQEYVALHNDSAQAKAYFAGLGMGKSTSMNNVTRDDLFMKPVPLPPLAEQAAIVERVESLMATCRALEAEIEQTRTHAADLLQAVLKEAFAPASS